MNICMIGSGYVGLVTGACFAEFGYKVFCVDKDQKKIKNLQQGHIPIYEPGLEALVRQGIQKKQLSFTTNLKDSVKDAEVIMIAVGTPSRHGEDAADLSYVFKAAEEIAESLSKEKYAVIVTKSTVPVGTARQVAAVIAETRPDLRKGIDYDVASNPEFLREGSAISDFMRPDRVVLGANSKKAEDLLRKLYRPLYLIETPIICTDLETAELAKYAANGFLALKIGFINQIADVCEKAGANVQDVAKAMGLDGRIGPKFLHAGPGYGGSCFPKDTRALSQVAKKLGASMSIVDAIIDANETRKHAMAKRIINRLKPGQQQVAILGITFKPNTDDLREAPSLVIVPELLKAGFKVKIYDPLYYQESDLFKGATWASNPYDAMEGSHAMVIITEWNEFRALDLEKAKKILKTPLLFDFRNIYKEEDVEGFEYHSIGRPLKGTPLCKGGIL